MKAGWTFSQTLALVALLGCGGQPAERRLQTSKALPEAAGAPVRTLRVVARIDSTVRQVPGHAQRVGERIDAASDELAALFGLRLELVQVVPDDAPAGELHRALEGLEGAEPAADLVILFTSAPLPPRPTMADLVQSQYLGRAIALRSLAPLFPPEAADALHRAEVVTLQHGLAVILGALPSCRPGLMASAPVFLQGGEARFNPLNLQLIRTHLSIDLGRGRVPPDIARRADALLAEGAGEVCPPGVLERRRVLLAEVLAPPPPEDPGEAMGLAALAEGRDAEAFTACERVAQRAPASPAARCAGVAAARLGRGPEAIRYLRAWLAHHSDDGEAVLLLAREVGRSGDDGAARALLQRFVDAHPDHLQARINLGVALARLGDLAGARHQWAAVLERDPENADARELMAQLP